MDKVKFNELMEKRKVPKDFYKVYAEYYKDWERLAEILDVELIIEDINPDNFCDIKYTLNFCDKCPDVFKQKAYSIFNAILDYQMQYDTFLGLKNMGLLITNNTLIFE